MINLNRNSYSFEEFFDSIREKSFFEKVDSSLFDNMNYIGDFDFIYKDDKNALDVLVSIFKEKYKCNIYRPEKNVIYIMCDNFTISCEVSKSVSISSIRGTIYTSDINFIDVVEQTIKNNINLEILNANIFSLNWYFMSRDGPTYSNVKGISSDILLDSAYPSIDGGIEDFIDKYLSSDESVLILTGPPGTGKTRLIKHILGKISKRKGEISKAIYTGDELIFKTESVFIDFVTKDIDAFVVEDADYLLEDRKSGNKVMHNFLKGADGLIASQNKKMIFSVNLAGKQNIDPALIRPGRCFGVYHIDNLNKQQAQEVVGEISILKNKKRVELVDDRKYYSLAELYKIVNEN